MKTKILQTPFDDITLWTNLKEGDEKSFSLLFERYYRDLVNYGNSLSPFAEKVQDCIQDVFTDVWVYRNSLQGSVVVKAYLLSSVRKRIARLHERDHIFRKAASTDSVAFLLKFSVEHELIDDDDDTTRAKVTHLNELLNNLPVRQKEALYLRYHQGLTVEQIAEMLDVNYQSASNLLYRGLLTLRKEWKGTFSIIALLSSSTF
ncbi:sigma-70 family RNA polymerase sigma factor [Flavobacterium sp. Fl-318]|jgi:RNA polymerase sigma factor (sigma-70 family)|uniref:Sigma-70 family RNA polymerase sigma factor n=1 Tax=Flavobacterium cupriresistens TaxID=2893885 RepID=A0ABU4R9A9_9FLAO|nr:MULTISPECIES: sigma-70 family RNA polymerase sigma factor [unclassified Flavobacterium]MDX6189162.1 sigma-70 family RNA polymerase sigma factor [Flavobacterium sp. Fl-318]UFH41259.1 sigma-70 family RNA polymerase sigma factor [Flavobacterium sp. F-323]